MEGGKSRGYALKRGRKQSLTKILYLSVEVEIKLILASSASNQSGSLNGPELNPFFIF